MSMDTTDFQVRYYDRELGEERSTIEPSSGALDFAYGTPVGRLLLKVMASSGPSAVWGSLMRLPVSRGRIRRFCCKNGITNASLVRDGFAPMDAYVSYADFFAELREVIEKYSKPEEGGKSRSFSVISAPVTEEEKK